MLTNQEIIDLAAKHLTENGWPDAIIADLRNFGDCQREYRTDFATITISVDVLSMRGDYEPRVGLRWAAKKLVGVAAAQEAFTLYKQALKDAQLIEAKLDAITAIQESPGE